MRGRLGTRWSRRFSGTLFGKSRISTKSGLLGDVSVDTGGGMLGDADGDVVWLPGADGAALGSADRRQPRGCGVGKKARGGSVIQPLAK